MAAGAGSSTILHTVLFCPRPGMCQRSWAVIAKFNELPGIAAQFHPYGVGVEGS